MYDHYWSIVPRNKHLDEWHASNNIGGAIPRLILEPAHRTLFSLLAAWRIADVYTLASIVGIDRAHISRSLNEMYSAGLVEWRETVSRHGRYPKLWRIARNNTSVSMRNKPSSAALDFMKAAPTYQEWLRMSGGYPLTVGPATDMHNLLGLQFAAQVANNCDVHSVVGERLASPHVFLPPELSTKFDTQNAVASQVVRGDGVIVRGDGLRIVFDICRGRSEIPGKIGAWSKIVADSPLETTGTVVLFIDASTRTEVKPPTANTFKKSQSELIAGVGNGNIAWASGRIFIGAWTEWFPSPDNLDLFFSGLPAYQINVNGDPIRVDLTNPETVPLTGWTPPSALLELYGVLRPGEHPRPGSLSKWTGRSRSAQSND